MLQYIFMLKKEKIEKFLEELGIDDLVTNFQIMENIVHIDMLAHSPAMHERKKIETLVHQSFGDKFGDKYDLKLKVSPPTSQKQNIKGKPIDEVSNIIAVASGKGGVGKSTIASNLAISLAKMGYQVGLLDADIYGPSIPTMFDTEGKKPEISKKGAKHLIKPIENYGIKLLSIGYFSQMEKAIVWRGPMASKALHQMIRDTDWGKLDFLLIDLPPGTGDIHLSLIQELPITGAIIIGTPQKLALADVRKGIAMFQMESINVPILGVIENMAYFTPNELPENKYYIFGEKGSQKLAQELNIPILGEIPLIQSIRESGDNGKPTTIDNNTTAKIYNHIAEKILENLKKRNENLPPTTPVKIIHTKGCSSKEEN